MVSAQGRIYRQASEAHVRIWNVADVQRGGLRSFGVEETRQTSDDQYLLSNP